jgi:predicted nucleotidyltransferase
MGTVIKEHSISSVLFGKTRRAILLLLFSHTDEAYYYRQIVRASGLGQGAVQRELKLLSSVGIITRKTQGKQVYYQANKDCPVYEEIKNLVSKTVGYVDILKTAIAPLLDRIQCAFIYGSVAKGREKRGSDVDVLVIGDVSFSELVESLAPASVDLRREINVTVYPTGEFKSKIKKGHHFLNQVIKGQKLFLAGDENELKGLAR